MPKPPGALTSPMGGQGPHVVNITRAKEEAAPSPLCPHVVTRAPWSVCEPCQGWGRGGHRAPRSAQPGRTVPGMQPGWLGGQKSAASCPGEIKRKQKGVKDPMASRMCGCIRQRAAASLLLPTVPAPAPCCRHRNIPIASPGPRHPQNCSKTPPQPLSLQSRARARADPSAPTLPPLSSILRAAWRAFPCPAPRSQTGGMLQGGALEPALLFAVPHFAVLQLLARPGSPAQFCSLSLLAQPPRTLRTACPALSSRRHLALLSAPHRAQIGLFLPKTGSPCAPQEQGSQPQRGRPLSKAPALSQAAGTPRGAALTLVGLWPPGPVWGTVSTLQAASQSPEKTPRRRRRTGDARRGAHSAWQPPRTLCHSPCRRCPGGGRLASTPGSAAGPREVPVLGEESTVRASRRAEHPLRAPEDKAGRPHPSPGHPGQEGSAGTVSQQELPSAPRWFSTRAAWCCQMTPFCPRKQVSLPQVNRVFATRQLLVLLDSKLLNSKPKPRWCRRAATNARPAQLWLLSSRRHPHLQISYLPVAAAAPRPIR